MRRQILFTVMLLMSIVSLASSNEKEVTIHFEKDRSELTAEAIVAIDELIASMASGGEHHFIVHGHTDSDGSVQYNTDLSMARAKVVQDRLIAAGIDPASIRIAFSGELRPAASNQNDDGMAFNRRVTITHIHHFFDDISDLQDELFPKEVQHFIIDPTKDEMLFGKDGTVLKFQANTLVDPQGKPVQGNVEVQLSEALDLESMIAHSLSTRSGDRLLETGGMLKVEAFQGDRALALRQGSNIEIAVPTTDPAAGMELFYSNDGSDWNVADQKLEVIHMDSVFSFRETIEMPLKPTSSVPFELPKFRPSMKGRPTRLTSYALPKRPIEPRPQSYCISVPWWKFWGVKEAHDKANRRYQEAVRVYETKKERYDRAMLSYASDTSGYAQKLANYECRLEEWTILQDERYKEWCNTTRRDAIEKYRELVKAEGPLLAPLIQNWDSLYNARSQAYWLDRHQKYMEWRERQNARYEEKIRAADARGSANMNNLNAYVFNTTQLGWINCDRFIDYPQNTLQEIVVKNEGPRDKQVMVIFTDINSMMTMELDGDKYRTLKVPRTEKAILFAYTVIKGKAHICEEDIHPGEQPKLQFQPSSMAEVRDRLNTYCSKNS